MTPRDLLAVLCFGTCFLIYRSKIYWLGSRACTYYPVKKNERSEHYCRHDVGNVVFVYFLFRSVECWQWQCVSSLVGIQSFFIAVFLIFAFAYSCSEGGLMHPQEATCGESALRCRCLVCCRMNASKNKQASRIMRTKTIKAWGFYYSFY